jgi:hypothetical protein
MDLFKRFRAIAGTPPAHPAPAAHCGEPLDHPALRGLRPRELADLPVPRHCRGDG